MIDIRILEKIRELKNRFIDGDDSAKKQITEWENRIMELSALDDFANSLPVQEIRKLLKERVKQYVVKRLHGDISDAKSLKDKEDECRYILSLFSKNYSSEIDSIESVLDSELA